MSSEYGSEPLRLLGEGRARRGKDDVSVRGAAFFEIQRRAKVPED